MTPLKYRAYHHAKGIYIPVRNILCDPQGSPIAISSGGIDAKRIPISQVTLERWTGRLDRNGVEVYENDLIQRYIEPAHGYFYLSNITLVEWKDNARYTGWGITKATERRIEVIGNRHQHAALLTAVAV